MSYPQSSDIADVGYCCHRGVFCQQPEISRQTNPAFTLQANSAGIVQTFVAAQGTRIQITIPSVHDTLVVSPWINSYPQTSHYSRIPPRPNGNHLTQQALSLLRNRTHRVTPSLPSVHQESLSRQSEHCPRCKGKQQ